MQNPVKNNKMEKIGVDDDDALALRGTKLARHGPFTPGYSHCW